MSQSQSQLGLEAALRDARGSPYRKPIIAAVFGISPVVKYCKADGEEKEMATLGLVDKSVVAKGLLYDVSKLGQIQEGSTYLILNSITKKDPPAIVITKLTKMSKTAGIGDSIPDALKASARALANPPTAESRTIADAKLSPVKELSTVRGQVVSVCTFTIYFTL